MEASIILYDGSCGLCARSVRFVLRHDKREQFLFAGLESETGRRIREQAGGPVLSSDSVVLAEEGRVYLQSTAALRIARRLGWPWSTAYLFILVPRFLRDAVYAWLARNRHRWFGRAGTCVLPDPAHGKRFLP